MMEINDVCHKIRVTEIWSDNKLGCCNVFLDDRQLKGVKSYEISHDAGDLAKITLYAYSDTIVEETGHVEWVATPRTVEEAVSILKKAAKDGVMSRDHFAEYIDKIRDCFPVTGV